MTPPAQICDNAAILGGGPASAPAGAITVPAGDNSDLTFTFRTPGKTFWFAPGVHTLGSDRFSQIQPGDGSTFVGAPGAIIDGQRKNQYAFTGPAKNVTIRYLTVRNFVAPRDEAVVNGSAGDNWTVEFSTLTRCSGAAVMLGSHNVLRQNCLKDNGQYGFSVYHCATYGAKPYPAACANQGPGTGTRVQDILLESNEITGNNQDDWETQVPGCGCTGGGKFWDVDGAVVRNNWVHDNRSVGLWADTNDRNFLFEGNYIADNDAEGIFYEISYNARIIHNTFLRNNLRKGPTSVVAGFPAPAVYISESGGDAIASGDPWLDVMENYFEDNWNGVAIWENANRFCTSIANTSSDYCTLHFEAGYDLSHCAGDALTSNLDRCRWKSQNVRVERNVFRVDRARIGCTSKYVCGMNAVFSNYGSDWSPFVGLKVAEAIAFRQNNVFKDNRYVGQWTFMPYTTDRFLDFATWQAAPYGQDAGSTIEK